MISFEQILRQIHFHLSSIVWGAPGMLLLLATGVLMTCLTGGFQVTRFRLWMGATGGRLFSRETTTTDGSALSPFQTMCTALAASVGVGNIAGVAAAIATGGPGAIFWMWVAAFFGMMTGYAENVLGMRYRHREGGEWVGGPMYYLRDGLGKFPHCRWLGKCLAAAFALFCLAASFGMGNIGQINAIIAHIEAAFPAKALSGTLAGSTVYSLLLGGLVMLATGGVLWGGTQRIARITEKLVPGMILLFLVGCAGVLCHGYRQLLPALGAILRGAFIPRAVAGGGFGVALRATISCGMKRGMFSNEAGLGSSVLVHTAARTRDPVQQGMWSIFEVFVDTIVMCTLTALVILVSGVVDLSTGCPAEGLTEGILVAAAFCRTYGPIGEQFVAIAVLLFAFSTLLGWSHYGSRAAIYLGGRRAATAYRIVFVLLILPGATLASPFVWEFSDTCNGLMMLPNLIGVLALSGQVRRSTAEYLQRHSP